MPIAPVNYQALLTQLDFTPLMQGMQMRSEREDAKAARAEQTARRSLAESKFSQEQDEDKRWRADLADISADFTPEKLRDLMWKHPDKQEALKSGFDTYNSYQQRDVISASTSVLGALNSGNTDFAAKVLADRKAALAEAGVNTDQTDALLRLVKSPDPADRQRAYAMLGMVMAGAVGPEHAAGVMENLGIGAKAERQARKDQLDQDEFEERRRHNRASEGVAAGNLALSRQREGRVARGSGKAAKPAKLPSGFILD
ncbi:hypothetical protein KZ810_03270 [Sphingomonas sp. RHCKR47]|uniref:hypothetical protein n=1 Tax=Sphingomonas citricola TaxID=2862498 RepID=UPI001CA5F08C|nr:hypothetical protein [Sphingomonas citricola]MBW6522507.1 hypothetical protein [Sphingomonas citricola]